VTLARSPVAALAGQRAQAIPVVSRQSAAT
jgi:hypothetical protein